MGIFHRPIVAGLADVEAGTTVAPVSDQACPNYDLLLARPQFRRWLCGMASPCCRRTYRPRKRWRRGRKGPALPRSEAAAPQARRKWRVNLDSRGLRPPDGGADTAATNVKLRHDGRVRAGIFIRYNSLRAKVAELADAPDLGSGPARGGGSSPPFRTKPSFQRAHGRCRQRGAGYGCRGGRGREKGLPPGLPCP